MKGANWDWWRELSNCSEDLPLSEGEREGKEGGREEGFQTRIHFYKNSSKAFREYSSQSFPSRNPKSASVSLPHWDIEGTSLSADTLMHSRTQLPGFPVAFTLCSMRSQRLVLVATTIFIVLS